MMTDRTAETWTIAMLQKELETLSEAPDTQLFVIDNGQLRPLRRVFFSSINALVLHG